MHPTYEDKMCPEKRRRAIFIKILQHCYAVGNEGEHLHPRVGKTYRF